MSARADAWAQAAEYALAVAAVGDRAARDRGVEAVRIEEMRIAFRLLQGGDPDAFYVCVSEYATNGAQAVAQLVAARAETEIERSLVDEPTDPVIVSIPPEARGPR